MFTIVSDLVVAEHKALGSGVINTCIGIAMIMGNASSGKS